MYDTYICVGTPMWARFYILQYKYVTALERISNRIFVKKKNVKLKITDVDVMT